MKRFKFLSCIGLLALVSVLASPPGALASDNLFIDNQNTVQLVAGDIINDFTVKPYDGDVVAMATSIAIGLRSGLTILKYYENCPSCTPATSWIGEGGDASACSKPRSLI